MINKKKISIIFFTIVILLVILGFYSLGTKHNPLAQALKSLIPGNVKVLLKKSIFSIPLILQKNESQDARLKKLERKLAVQDAKIEAIENKNSLIRKKTREVVGKKNKYSMSVYKLPIPSHYDWGLKPVAYVDQTKEDIYFASGKGDFFTFPKLSIGSQKISYKIISSNIKDLIFDEKLYEPYITSIKDLLIKDDYIYFSFGTTNKKKDCYELIVMRAKINKELLNFKKFFSKKDCQSYRIDFDMNYQHIGGRMVKYKNDEILLSVGDFGDEKTPQIEKSIFGKIISINNKNNYKIISSGSRNAQGLIYDIENDIILNTEHGPVGGDEVNININPEKNKIKNFGWPIVSYGTTSTGETYPTNHKKLGFIEPIKYFTPSIGISEILQIPESFDVRFTNDFFVNALGFESQWDEGDQSIHHIRLDDKFKNIIFEDIIPIHERIRDTIYVKENNSVLLILETIPAIGFLKINN